MGNFFVDELEYMEKKYAEIFEYSPYGRKASQEEFQALFDL